MSQEFDFCKKKAKVFEDLTDSNLTGGLFFFLIEKVVMPQILVLFNA